MYIRKAVRLSKSFNATRYLNFTIMYCSLKSFFNSFKTLVCQKNY